MRSTPAWLGPVERSLFGWWHTPDDGTARAAVVLCPPFGAELLAAHRAYHDLSAALVARGFAVLRFDFDGTGDSVGDLNDSAGPVRWADDVRRAVASARKVAGQVAVVGLRLAAALADQALADADVDAEVLWDPCSGKQFLREQRARHALTAGGDEVPDGAVAGPSFLFPARLVPDIRAVDIPDRNPERRRQLILVRGDRRPDPALSGRRDSAGVQWAEIAGQEEFLGVSTLEAVVPTVTVELIVDWLDSSFVTTTHRLVDAPLVTELAVHEDTGGTPIAERAVTLGPLGLFGITTAPVGGEPGGPVVVFLNVAAEHHIGPGRLWVDLARQWAHQGVTSVRLDLSGIGDSPARPGQVRDETHAVEALQDMVEAAAAVSPADPARTIPVGMCSGGYHALEWGYRIGAAGVCAINPILDFPAPELVTGGPLDPQRAMALPARPGVKAVGRSPRMARWKARAPGIAWRVMDAAGVYHSPLTKVEHLVARGVDTLLICGDEDGRPYLRSPWILTRLARGGQFHFEVVPDADHSLQRVVARDRVAEIATRYVIERARLAPVPAGLATASPSTGSRP